MNRIVKSVSFSKDDEFEMMMITHSKRYGNFSKYVKRLIQRDLEGGSSQLTATTHANHSAEITVDHSYVSSVI
jgi:hypothetical protein